MVRPKVKPGKKNAPQKAQQLIVVPDLEVIPDLDLDVTQPDTQQEGETQQEEDDEASTSGLEAARTSPLPSTSAFPPPNVAVPKKSYRVSHKQINNYKFTASQIEMLREFIKDNPCLYVKTDPLYADHKNKVDLWTQCAAMFDECTNLQCRKFYEQKRTAFGKIEAQEMRSGSAARERTPREQLIMEQWGFLKGHISHTNTTSSQIFTSPNESSSASESGLSAASIERRKIKKKKRTGDTSASSSHDVTAESVEDPQPDVDMSDVRRLIDVASTLSSKQQRPWANTEIEYFTNLIGFHVHALHEDDQREAMMEALAVVHQFETRRKKAATDQTQTVQPTSVDDGNQGQPSSFHQAVLPSTSQPAVLPPTSQPAVLPPTSQPAVLPPTSQPAVLPPTPAQPPNQMSPLNQMSPFHFINPTTPGQWCWQTPSRPMTPYHVSPQQLVQYGLPSTSGYQPPYGGPPVGPPTTMQPTQPTMHPTQPSTCGGDMPAATTTSYTTLQPATTPTDILHLVESLPSLTPAMQEEPRDSSIHTPELKQDASEKN